MDFDLDDDDLAIQAGIRSFCAGRFPIEVVRRGELTDSVVDTDRWREIAEMGVFAIGGDGLTRRQAALAFEELGRALVPGPLVDTALAAQVSAAAAAGDLIAVLLHEPDPVAVVEFPAQARAVLRLADDGVHLAEGVTLDATSVERPLDALTPVGLLRTPPPAGDLVGGADVAARMTVDALVLTAAQQVGLAAGATELATAYAKERQQFGRVIGAFQAVKHLLADMLVKAEVARVAVHAAACAADGAGDGDPLHLARVAKMLAGDAALFCGKTGIQVHGGMGFTWEVDAQRYWKRACVLDTHLANGDRLAELVAAAG